MTFDPFMLAITGLYAMSAIWQLFRGDWIHCVYAVSAITLNLAVMAMK